MNKIFTVLFSVSPPPPPLLFGTNMGDKIEIFASGQYNKY